MKNPPPDIPTPAVMNDDVDITVYVNASHRYDLVTRRSMTGILLQEAKYSKIFHI